MKIVPPRYFLGQAPDNIIVERNMKEMIFHDITTLDTEGNTREHQTVITEGAFIRSIAPCENTIEEARQSGDIVYDGAGKLLIPGFFNNHSHVPMTLTRGYGEGLLLQEWLYDRIFPFEALLTEEDVYWGALLGIAEMLRGGTVSFTDMYMRLGGISRAVIESGIKANISNGLNGDDSTKLEETAWYRETEAVIDASTSSDGRLIADASLHAQYTSTPHVVEQLVRYTKDRQLNMHVHLSETEGEHHLCKKMYGKTPTHYFYDFGLFDVPTTAAHAIFIEDEDYPLLIEKGVTLTHMPSCNLKIGSGIADIKKWHDHGINVTIGTDGAGSNNNLDMIEEVTWASYIANGIHRNPVTFTNGELLSFATRNGALAQGRDDTGLLKEGFRADLAVVDMNALHFYPHYDLGTSLFTSANASDVCLTMVDGRVLYQDGHFTTIDIERVIANATRCRDEIIAALKKA